MIRRLLLGAALVAAGLSRLNCQLVFRYEGAPPINAPFLGCFRGPLTEPAGGTVTIVLEAAPSGDGAGNSGGLVGCMKTEPGFDATLSGSVRADRTVARVDVVPAGPPLFVMRVTRRPQEGNATELDLRNLSAGAFFRSANGIMRCAPDAVVTCADLGLGQTFLPPGQP